MNRQIVHKTIAVDGVDVFYREAGGSKRPSLLLLHGFPTSSIMFKNLMVALSDQFHLIAPDYPGFGFSAFPAAADFEYSFDNIAMYINRFTETIGLRSFSIYLHDYGCPIGLRIAVRNPKKIERMIVQNGNAYREGMEPQWDETIDYWNNPDEEKKKKVTAFLSEEGVKMQYTAGLSERHLRNVSPESWILDWERMSRPGNVEMQFALNCTYQTNMEMFPVFQKYFRDHQPAALILWGKHDAFFDVAEAMCYKRDLPKAQIHILDGGHMALETNFDEVLNLMKDFLHST